MPLPIEIFRAGRHTDMNGVTLSFSAAEVLAAASAYDRSAHEAPIVVGHPAADAPAYGWVKGLSCKDGVLSADVDQLDPAFAELVQAGRFNKVSASFYLPTASSNPKPGGYYLRHVGFLGAMAPAVKGLKPVAFADAATDSVTLEFGDFGERTVAQMFRSLRDWMLAKFGQEEADKALPPWQVDTTQEIAAQPTPAAAASPAFAEPASTVVADTTNAPTATPTPSAEDVAREVAFAEREAKIAEREAQLSLDARARRRAEHTTFLDGLVAQGRVLPCKRELLVEFMELVAGDQVVSFGETEARSPLEVFRSDVLAHLPKQAELAELAAPEVGTAELEGDLLISATIAFQEARLAKGEYLTTSQAMARVRNGEKA
jgi:hypothetical protein